MRNGNKFDSFIEDSQSKLYNLRKDFGDKNKSQHYVVINRIIGESDSLLSNIQESELVREYALYSLSKGFKLKENISESDQTSDK